MTDFETATGYAPELLADTAAVELQHLLQLDSYNAAMLKITDAVEAHARRVWAVSAHWRRTWTRQCRAGNNSSLKMFFRHWTAAEAKRQGIALPEEVQRTFGLGIKQRTK